MSTQKKSFLASGQQLCDRFYVLILRTGREDYSSQDDTLTSHQLQAPKHVCRCGSLVSLAEKDCTCSGSAGYVYETR